MRTPFTSNAWDEPTLQVLQKQQNARHLVGFRRWQDEQLGIFMQQGFPHRKHEHWKYTNVSAIAKQAFALMVSDVATTNIHALRLAHAHVFVFVNGHFISALSQPEALPAGVMFWNMKTLLTERDLSSAFTLSDVYHTPFSSLNAALLTDGLCLSIPDHTVLDRPIHLLCVTTDGEKASMSHPRHWIQIGVNSRAVIFEEYVGCSRGSYFNNVVMHMDVGEGAEVQYYKLQREGDQAFHIANTIVRQQKKSRVESYHVAMGAQLGREDLRYALQGEETHSHLWGLYCARDQRTIDCHSRIDHTQSRGSSEQHYRGIASSSSRAVFNGKIVVHPQAQQTQARQTNKNLLLSSTAEVNTKPELEIYAHDVQCTHGATVGQLDEEALFYLCSRGIDRLTARQLLIHAFVDEILSQLKHTDIAEKITQNVAECLAISLRGDGYE
ncbi:MAG: Fe-S cluster assembly protein SufD [Coxiella sp. RIFCSPHIGHO2_12_FULL_44_14]|nr:MAG: Fe-S cluster assembly protein SufD [Coxiella sp. RIFCSPHIGHO2_12_FULL_44_14]